MTVKPEQAKVSAYFNIDNGTGKIRGVYMQGNAAVQPIFEAWMRPFKDLGMDTLTMRDTGGTDHLSFDAAGIPHEDHVLVGNQAETIVRFAQEHHCREVVLDDAPKGGLQPAQGLPEGAVEIAGGAPPFGRAGDRDRVGLPIPGHVSAWPPPRSQ